MNLLKHFSGEQESLKVQFDETFRMPDTRRWCRCGGWE